MKTSPKKILGISENLFSGIRPETSNNHSYNQIIITCKSQRLQEIKSHSKLVFCPKIISQKCKKKNSSFSGITHLLNLFKWLSPLFCKTQTVTVSTKRSTGGVRTSPVSRLLRLFSDFCCKGGQALHVVCTSKGGNVPAERCVCVFFFVVCCCSPTEIMYGYMDIHIYYIPGTWNIHEFKCLFKLDCNFLLGKWLGITKQSVKKWFRIEFQVFMYIYIYIPPRKSKSTIRIATGLKELLAFMDMEKKYSTQSSKISGT